MNRRALYRLAPLIAALLASLILFAWWYGSRKALQPRVPLLEDEPVTAPSGEDRTFVQDSRTETFDVPVPDLPGSWPRFRGPAADGVSREASFTLLTDWSAGPPPELWSIEAGEGYAGVAVHAGRVYLMDHDRDQHRDVLRCLSLETGQDIWRFSYPVEIRRNHGITRTVPAVNEKYVVSMGPKGHTCCLDAATGELIWAIDLVGRFGTTIPQWNTGQCPLIDGERVILAPAGTALLVAVGLATGEVLWETPNPRGWKMTHSSVMPVRFADRDTFVYVASGGVVGVDAVEGTLLWEITDWKVPMANIPSPVLVGEDTLFVTGGYDAGSALVRLTRSGDGIAGEIVRRMPTQHFGAHQHTPVALDGYVYGIGADGQLACLDARGDVVWRSGADVTFGKAPLVAVQGHLLVLDDMGTLYLVRAAPDRFELTYRAKVLDGPDAWGPPAVAGGLLIVRDLNRVKCLDIRADGPPPAALYREVLPPIETGLVRARSLAAGGGDRLYVAGDDGVAVLDATTALARLETDGSPTCLTADADGRLYVGVKDHVEVFDAGDGRRLAVWDSLGEDAWLTSLLRHEDELLAADAGNRVVLRYGLDGSTLGALTDDPRFVVPSPFFDLADGPADLVLVANPGQHRIELTTPAGEVERVWGRAGTDEAGFVGCCNPINVAVLPTGDVVTAEKGVARIKTYTVDGTFLGLVTDDFADHDLACAGREVHEVGLDLAVDSRGRIAVLERCTGRVRTFEPVERG